MSLTDRQIKTAKANDADLFLSDGRGLYLRVRASGTKTWLYRYKSGTQTRWLELGTYPGSTLAEARLEAQKAKAQRLNGADPVESKKKRLAETAAEIARITARDTVKDLFDRWEQLDLCNHKDGGAAVRRLFEKDVLPVIGDMAVEDVRKTHVISVVDNLLARRVDRLAKMTLSLMRQMFRFAQDRDIIESDPTAAIRKAKIGKPDTERDRVLSEDEIRELCIKMPEGRLAETTEAAIWIALSTGCRIGELLKARWQDVDLDKGTWVITSENSKNGEALTVYLSTFTIKHFQRLKSINHQTEWCYPDRSGKNHVCPKTITKQVSDRQLEDDRKPMMHRSKHATALKLSGGSKWTCHDLRRTAGTLMTALGVLPDIADKCLNHKEQNRIRRTYLRHSYETEKREAWRRLGDRLNQLVQPGHLA